MSESGRSNFPAYKGKLDNIVSVVSVKSVLATFLENGIVDIGASVTKPLYT